MQSNCTSMPMRHWSLRATWHSWMNSSMPLVASTTCCDPASKKEGGKFTAQQGATVAPFDKVAFDLDTGELSEPVKTQFGWHIIEAVGDIKEKSTQDLSAVEEQIRSTLLEEKKNTRINEWIEELRARFEDQTAYAPGFEPPPPAETTTGEGDTGGETGTTTTE